jgi:hypothetical protein
VVIRDTLPFGDFTIAATLLLERLCILSRMAYGCENDVEKVRKEGGDPGSLHRRLLLPQAAVLASNDEQAFADPHFDFTY